MVIATLSGFIERLALGNIKSIAVLTGAGISSGAGIPDFRSPGGLYSTLNPSLLTATPSEKAMMTSNPTAVVDYDLFRHNQFPYLEVRRPFILGTAEGKWKPTISHFFIRLLFDKGLLRRLYTQNIDGLHQMTGIPSSHVVPIHGSIFETSCEFCHQEYPRDAFYEEMKEKIRNIYDPNDKTAPTVSTNILCRSCKKPGVKPSTVLFGRNLPTTFFTSVENDFPSSCDLLLIMGTLLVVSPANSLVQFTSRATPRVLLNMERVGEELGMFHDSNVS